MCVLVHRGGLNQGRSRGALSATCTYGIAHRPWAAHLQGTNIGFVVCKRHRNIGLLRGMPGIHTLAHTARGGFTRHSLNPILFA